jgi:hypothetical protein
MKTFFKVLVLAITFKVSSYSVFPAFENKISGNKNLPFKTRIHKEVNSQMLERALTQLNISFAKDKTPVCQARLNRSQILQDFFLPFMSKGHFDNCAFGKSINYINRLQKQNDSFAEELLTGADPDDPEESNLLKRKILFNTCKILHAVQDFYSHSNYVELMEEEQPELAGVPVLRLWETDDQNKILKMYSNEVLISGTAWWVFPQKCKKGSPSHKKLAKDSNKFRSGRKYTNWSKPGGSEKFTRFEAALFLARQSTYQFLLHTLNKYPMLKEHCGNFQQSISGN